MIPPSQLRTAILPRVTVHVIWAAALNKMAVSLLRPLTMASVCPECENGELRILYKQYTSCILFLKLKDASWDAEEQCGWKLEFLLYPICVAFLLMFFFDPEDGGKMSVQCVGLLLAGCTALHLKRQNSSQPTLLEHITLRGLNGVNICRH
jgi:hypothetical protein